MSTVLQDAGADGKQPAMEIKAKKEEANLKDLAEIDDGYEEDEIDIRPDKYITLVNLCAGELNLSTLPGGRGKVFSFHSFGEKKRILYSNLVDIMEANPRFTEEGFYYIADKKVIRKHGLADIYDGIITKEKIDQLFTDTLTENDAEVIYKSANKSQQAMIVDLIASRISKGVIMNLNIVSAISRLSKVDILKQMEEAKFYSQSKE